MASRDDNPIPDPLAIFDRVPAAIYRIAPDGRLIYINKSGATIAGYSQDEIRDLPYLSHAAEASDSPSASRLRQSSAARRSTSPMRSR